MCMPQGHKREATALHSECTQWPLHRAEAFCALPFHVAKPKVERVKMLLQITALQLALLCTVYAQFLDEDELTYQQLYDWGMESYNEERWCVFLNSLSIVSSLRRFECTAYFKRAIEDHDSFHSKLLKCRHECEAEMRERYARAFQQQIYDSVHEKGSALRYADEQNTTKAKAMQQRDSVGIIHSLLATRLLNTSQWLYKGL